MKKSKYGHVIEFGQQTRVNSEVISEKEYNELRDELVNIAGRIGWEGLFLVLATVSSLRENEVLCKLLMAARKVFVDENGEKPIPHHEFGEVWKFLETWADKFGLIVVLCVAAHGAAHSERKDEWVALSVVILANWNLAE
jgi:hypothetical protein